MASFSFTFSRISSSDSLVCSRRAKATLSRTVIESKRAALWKTMPMRVRKRASSWRSMTEMFSPSTMTSP